MLTGFGATVITEILPGGGRRISIHGQPELVGRTVVVPADPSSAAFPVVAGLLTPNAHITLPGIGINPLRTGLFTTLKEMGADLVFQNERVEAGEHVADLVIKTSSLKGIDVPPERAPSMIDEYPILAVAAACATGTTRMLGVGELRVKESDRLGAMARGLTACGVKIEEDAETLIVHGTGAAPKGGVTIAANLDHRIAMSFLVLGMVSQSPMSIDDASSIDTSFPGFRDLMNGLGAQIEQGN
jgi:3-phosphoshikimate 1-carboxyvinyltransferase